MAKKPFYVEGMTVEQILSMNPREMMKLDTREISRALRTVSLAANKRINRLKQYAKKATTGYVPKGVKTQIATDALNWVTKNGKVKIPFGVKSAGTRNKMLQQISTIKQFMLMKSSTVTGATQLRKQREKKLFGKTREQAGRGQTKKQKQQTYNKFQEMNARVWELYYKFMELAGMDPHSVWSGSDEILEIVGHGVAEGKSDEEIVTEALNKVKEAYEESQEEYNKIFGDDWENFGSFE
jgi:hypothetical protein